MKQLLILCLVACSATFLTSCASQKGIELVGHYRHHDQAAVPSNNIGVAAGLQPLVSTSECQKLDLPGSTSVAIPARPWQAEPDMVTVAFSEKKQKRVEKIFQKLETKLERKSIELDQQLIQLNQAPVPSAASANLGLGWLILFALLLPPLAVALADGIGTSFWISIILTLLFWLPGVIYALIVVIP
jgi:uncharacterized membrane protein YqaE (UPF0057 family)